jgi:biopolymer transport protein ExbB/TolQ
VGGLNWVEMLISVLFAAVCAMAGALILMQRMVFICREERQYDLPDGSASLIGAAIGGISGLGAAILFIYYYFYAPDAKGWIEWVGRSSYVLILAASAAHLLTIIHTWIRLNAEDADLKGSGPQRLTLLVRRRAALEEIQHQTHSYTDLKTRDDEIVADLLSVLGDRLLISQRALSRVPFYGYLGTVCGILLMAQELARLDEATESFKVLRDMSTGLILAFKTTLVALLAYLPLRKGYDLLLTRMSTIERSWLALRDQAGHGSEH